MPSRSHPSTTRKRQKKETDAKPKISTEVVEIDDHMEDDENVNIEDEIVNREDNEDDENVDREDENDDNENVNKQENRKNLLESLQKHETSDEHIKCTSQLEGTSKMKKYGLQLRAPSQKKQSSGRPPLRTASIFGEVEDNDVEKEISRQASKTKALKEIEEQHKKALEEDPSAFAYDEVYDDMKQKAVLPRMQDREERKPRYIQHLMKQADQRQKEHEIVYERKLAKERAKDEHLFSDKDKFITGAYRKKLEEQKKWLAEERLRELREEKEDVTKKKDLSDFYFNIGKNVAFGARDIESREAERLEEQRKAEKLEELSKEDTREEKKTDSLEKEVSPESGNIGSSYRKSVEPQEASEKMGSDATEGKKSSIKEATKEGPKAASHHRKSEDAIAAAKERFLARKKAKIEE